ncbi:MAG: DUF502 domain-containing protein [Opitutales bacterium]|nr:DUF502 domain-containing protein [Opitutales bacterium]
MARAVRKRWRLLKVAKNCFLTGLFLLLPLGVTAIVVGLLLDYVGSPVSSLILESLGLELPDKFWMSTIVNLGSTILVVGLVTLLGFVSKYFLVRMTAKLLGLIESLINNVPFVSSVYKTVKQVVDTFNKNQEAVFQAVVLIEYPHKGMYALGFLTSETRGEVQVKTQQNVVNVFIPTTPNPTSGFLLFVPKEDVVVLEMSISDGMKMIISGGVVNPEYPPKPSGAEKVSPEDCQS